MNETIKIAISTENTTKEYKLSIDNNTPSIIYNGEEISNSDLIYALDTFNLVLKAFKIYTKRRLAIMEHIIEKKSNEKTSN